MQEVRVSSRELDLLSRSLKGDYTVLRSDVLAPNVVRDGQKFLQSIADKARKKKYIHVVLIAVLKE